MVAVVGWGWLLRWGEVGCCGGVGLVAVVGWGWLLRWGEVGCCGGVGLVAAVGWGWLLWWGGRWLLRWGERWLLRWGGVGCCSGVGLVVVVGTAVVEGGAIIEVCMLVVERCVYTRWGLWYGGMVGVVGRWLWTGVRRDKSLSCGTCICMCVVVGRVVAVVGRWLWTGMCRGKSSSRSVYVCGGKGCMCVGVVGGEETNIEVCKRKQQRGQRKPCGSKVYSWGHQSVYL